MVDLMAQKQQDLALSWYCDVNKNIFGARSEALNIGQHRYKIILFGIYSVQT